MKLASLTLVLVGIAGVLVVRNTAFHATRATTARHCPGRWRLNELELPSLRVLRSVPNPDGNPPLGPAQIVAVSREGAQVYVETTRCG